MTAEPVLRKELGLRDLVLFNLAALISTRWISVAAHVGPGTIVLWLLAAVLFLIPCAFVVANLSARFPEEGGMYIWTREAFGEWHGFACSWFYYLNNLFWIPGVLISLVGMTTYAFSEKAGGLAENPYYVLPCALALLVVVIAANYVGLKVAKWVDNFGGISVSNGRGGAGEVWLGDEVLFSAALGCGQAEFLVATGDGNDGAGIESDSFG